MMDLLKREGLLLLAAIKKSRVDRIPKKTVLQELLANGLAFIIASVVGGLSSIFFRKATLLDKVDRSLNIKVFQKVQGKDTIPVDEQVLESINWVLTFVITIIVFTYVEKVLEFYIKNRSGSDKTEQKTMLNEEQEVGQV